MVSNHTLALMLGGQILTLLADLRALLDLLQVPVFLLAGELGHFFAPLCLVND